MDGSKTCGTKDRSACRLRYSDVPWLAFCATYVRDKDSGKVVLGPDGLPRVHYWPSSHDQKSILDVRPTAIRYE
jgi:hypothetical protein